MGTNHKVKAGDCVSSIAFEHGFAPKTLEDHLENKELKRRRKDLNILLPGVDSVFVPDREQKTVERQTDSSHKFKRNGVPEVLKVRVLDALAEPVADAPYRVEIDGSIRHGRTDGDGRIKELIPPNAQGGSLVVETARGERKYDISLGRLPPISEVNGVQARLRNLGYEIDDEDGIEGPSTESALKLLQRRENLTVTGLMDDDTIERLRQYYES